MGKTPWCQKKTRNLRVSNKRFSPPSLQQRGKTDEDTLQKILSPNKLRLESLIAIPLIFQRGYHPAHLLLRYLARLNPFPFSAYKS